MEPAIVEAVGVALGEPVRTTRPIGGGDSSDAWRVELADDTVVFAKTDPDGIAGLFTSEADGLRRLAAPGTVRVPQVLAVADDDPTRFIVLGWIEPGRPDEEHDAELGRSLAALHRTSAPGSAWRSTTTSVADGRSTPGATPGPSSTAASAWPRSPDWPPTPACSPTTPWPGSTG